MSAKQISKTGNTKTEEKGDNKQGNSKKGSNEETVFEKISKAKDEAGKFAREGIMRSFDCSGEKGGKNSGGGSKGKNNKDAEGESNGYNPNGFGDPSYFWEETRMMM